MSAVDRLHLGQHSAGKVDQIEGTRDLREAVRDTGGIGVLPRQPTGIIYAVGLRQNRQREGDGVVGIACGSLRAGGCSQQWQQQRAQPESKHGKASIK